MTFRSAALPPITQSFVSTRIPMSFAIAALAGRAPSRIDGSDAVVISYPGFWDTLERLVA